MNDSEIKLVINKNINASVDKVYKAWTDPEVIKKWFGPGAMTVPNAEADLQVGGEYLIHMHDADAKSDHIVSGQYQEIIANEKLVFDWMWKDGVDRTQVTVEFLAKGTDETQLTLTHRGFSDQEFADKHNQGWGACLNGLENHFA